MWRLRTGRLQGWEENLAGAQPNSGYDGRSSASNASARSPESSGNRRRPQRSPKPSARHREASEDLQRPPRNTGGLRRHPKQPTASEDLRKPPKAAHSMPSPPQVSHAQTNLQRGPHTWTGPAAERRICAQTRREARLTSLRSFHPPAVSAGFLWFLQCVLRVFVQGRPARRQASMVLANT